ncbi:hypothetical protein M413DRAFT_14732 [Hebeloma cylindrosporum]|uniref:Uncharacterized protein n=1 Tax=Hebeloma cylindrosporum TaxID=76867 RepID=A0A0C2Y200_HEBCY|nr:hypothetical protein M413DRAFT_14732 [Hebeloma cylindrosporum h7]
MAANITLPNRNKVQNAIAAATGLCDTPGPASVWSGLLNSAGLQMKSFYQEWMVSVSSPSVPQQPALRTHKNKSYIFPPGYHVIARLAKEIHAHREEAKAGIANSGAVEDVTEVPDSPGIIEVADSPVSGDVEMSEPSVRPTRFIIENPAKPKEVSTRKRRGADTPKTPSARPETVRLPFSEVSGMLIDSFAYRKALHYEKKGAGGSNKCARVDPTNETFSVLPSDFTVPGDLSDSLISQAQAILDRKDNLSSWAESSHQRIGFARTELATSYFRLHHALRSYNYAIELFNKASLGAKVDAL